VLEHILTLRGQNMLTFIYKVRQIQNRLLRFRRSEAYSKKASFFYFASGALTLRFVEQNKIFPPKSTLGERMGVAEAKKCTSMPAYCIDGNES
jgi:hypothetical protein